MNNPDRNRPPSAGSSTTGQTPTRSEEGASKSPRKPKPPAYQSLADLIRAAYSGKRKRLALGRSDVSALRSQPELQEPERIELLRLAGTDRTLTRTRDLYLLCIGRLDTPELTRNAREFIGDVLRGHPAFRDASLAGILENLPDSPPEADALRSLAQRDFTGLLWPEGQSALKKKEIGQCRANAICCLLLWFRVTRGMTFERIQQYLNSYVWSAAARRAPSEVQRLQFLMTSRDAVVPGIASATYEKQQLILSQHLSALRENETKFTTRLATMKEEKDEVASRMHEAQKQVESLQLQLEELQRAHADDKAHLRDDYERLRGTVLRRLRDDVQLLDDGLQALSRDPPKIHVMLDHAERVVAALRREIDRIQGSD